MSSGPGIFRQLWFRWKTLKLPWRRQFLIGSDLAGNTFWEFKDAINANRLRRIVRYSRRAHFADVKISPQWHQWLRYTRDEAPSIQEQQHDVSRQAMMKQLASEADQRWKDKPSYLDSPDKAQPVPAVAPSESSAPAEPKQVEDPGVLSGVGDQQEVGWASRGGDPRAQGRKQEKDSNPWNNQPAEKWQDASWSPGVAQRR